MHAVGPQAVSQTILTRDDSRINYDDEFIDGDDSTR